MCTVTSGVLVSAVAACARPGNTPEGPPEVRTVTLTAEAAPASIARPDISSFVTRAPAKDGTVSCAQDPLIARLPSGEAPVPPPNRGAGPNDAQPNDAQPQGAQPQGAATAPRRAVPSLSDDAAERSRRTLEQQRTPLPRHGEIPEAAARGAEACARILSLELNLLQHSDIGLTPAAINRALTNTGLLEPRVAPGRFAASTGKACVAGQIVDGKAVLSITPPPCTP